MSTVLNIGFVLSFFLAILLFSKKGKVLTDNILSLWLVTIGIHLIGYFLNYNGYWELYPHLIGITAPLPFIYGPFLYLYLTYSIQKRSHLKPIDYLHFAPLILSYLYMIPFYFFYSAEEKVKVDKGFVDDFGMFSTILLIGVIVSGLVYSFISYRKLLQHKKIVQNNFSYETRISLSWLRYSIIAIGFAVITAGVVLIFRDVLGFEFPFNADILFYSIIVAFVVFVGYSGIRQQDLFSNTIKNEKELVNTESEYKKINLKPETVILKHKKLLKLMENERPYLNPSLTINDLSKDMEMNVRELSLLINHELNQHFFDFVNKYRIEKAKKILQDPMSKELTILEILYDVGFNSKSSFHTAFKKHSKQTPTEFRKSALKPVV